MIKAELRRLFNKKKAWLYYAVLYALFLAFILFLKQKQNIDASNYMSVGKEILSAFFVLFIGTHVFSTVYLDDISAGKYKMILSHRRSSKAYILAKSMTAFFALVSIALISWFFFTTVFVLFYSQDFLIYRQEISALFKIAFNRILLSLVFMNLAAIFAYYFQNASSGKAAYIVLTLNFIPSVLKIASLFSEKFNQLHRYIFSEYMNLWMMGEGKLSILCLLAFVYLFLSQALSYRILDKKDLA